MSARQATSLPKLLSLLPSDGRGALVRPLSAPGVVYRITRSKLKFTPRSDNVGQDSPEGSGSGTGTEIGELKVSGRAWGFKFNNGRFLPHTKSTLPTTKIDGQLRGLNKSKWVQVDEMDLDSATRQALTTKTAEVKGVQKS